MRFAQSLGGKTVLVLAIGVAAMGIAYPLWHGVLPDCMAGQPGPCGLTTLLAVLYSLATSLGCVLATILYFAAQHVLTRGKVDSER